MFILRAVACAGVCFIVAVAAAQEPSSWRGASVRFLSDANYLRMSSVRAELKLSDEQLLRLEDAFAESWRSDDNEAEPAVANGDTLNPRLRELLTDEQAQRFQQIVWQRQRTSDGLWRVFRDPVFCDALELTRGQQSEVEPLCAEGTKLNEAQRQSSTIVSGRKGPDPNAARRMSEAYTRLRESRESAERKLTALLTETQHARMLELFGSPFRPDLASTNEPYNPVRSHRIRAFRFGEFTELNPRYLTDAEFRGEIHPTDEQIEKLRWLTVKDAATGFTPVQLRRAMELTLQHAQQSYGPHGVFRYQVVVDAVPLSEAQRKQLLELVYADRLVFVRTTAAEAPSLTAERDRQMQEGLNGLLTEDQRTKLKALIGVPYAGGPLPDYSVVLTKQDGIESPRGWEMTTRFRVGCQYAPTASKLITPEFQKALPLSEQQLDALEGWVKSPLLERNPRLVEETLTPQQYQRAVELTLQSVQQGDGPIGPFGYVDVVDGLKLTNEQIGQLQAIATKESYAWTKAADRSRMAAATQQKLSAILTEAQSAELQRLLGEPYDGPLLFGALQEQAARARFPSMIGRMNIPLATLAHRYLSEPSVRDDLELSPEQVRQIEQQPGLRAKTLTGRQQQRLNEIGLQLTLRESGVQNVLHYKDVADPLTLNEDQIRRIEQILRDESRARSGRDATKVKEVYLETEQRIVQEVLNADQQVEWKKLFGEPFEGTLRDRNASRAPAPVQRADVGQLSLAALSTRYLAAPSVQQELQLRDDQVRRLQPQFANTQILSSGLSPEQLARLRQIHLQLEQRRAGPVEPLRYREVAEALHLSEKQQASIRALLEETAAARGTLAEMLIFRDRIDRQLRAALSSEQQAALERLLGEPFDGDVPATIPVGAPSP